MMIYIKEFNKKYRNILSASLVSVFFVFKMLYFTCEALADNFDSVSIYGLSNHFDDNSGKGYNEKNYGAAVTKVIFNDVIELELGYFKNSFYDDTYWISIQKEFYVTDRIAIVGDLRHWRTTNNTYEKRLIQAYPHLRLYVNDRISTNIILRKSGPIFYLRFNL